MTGIFGGEPKPPAGGNPDSNTLLSDMTTVICLDDYHSLDRNVRRGAGAVRPDAAAGRGRAGNAAAAACSTWRLQPQQRLPRIAVWLCAGKHDQQADERRMPALPHCRAARRRR